MVNVSETAARGGAPAAAAEAGPAHTAGPLAGVRVLELGSLIAGPFAGRQLADFGAEVIKIEAPSRPDPMREWGRAQVHGHTLWWSVQSRGKKCVTLDLKAARGRASVTRPEAASDPIALSGRRPRSAGVSPR